MDIRRPDWIRRVRAPGAEALAALFALESFARALLVSILPIEALRLVGDARGVSLLFLAASVGGVIGTLSVPGLVRLIQRRWTYTLGAAGLALAPFALGGDTPAWFLAGLSLRVLGVVCLTVCLSLYILDHVSRGDFGRSEPMRLFYAAGAWTLGPALGAWLSSRFGSHAAFAASSAAALLALAFFWYLRLRESPALMRPRHRPASPLSSVARFASQPRLALAWTVSVGRYIWWVMFFVYVPIYVVQSGYGVFAAGLVTSLGSALMFLLPLFGRVVRRHGCRAVLLGGFGCSAILTALAGLGTATPALAIALVLLATMAMVALDAVANMPFLLSVRHHERAEMTSVYSTYRDVGELTAPGLFALILHVLPLAAVFVVTGLAMSALAALSARVHPRLGRLRDRRLAEPA